jgi:hypothetical protein
VSRRCSLVVCVDDVADTSRNYPPSAHARAHGRRLRPRLPRQRQEGALPFTLLALMLACTSDRSSLFMKQNIGCDPDDYPTAKYIDRYSNGYSDYNITVSFPLFLSLDSLMADCQSFRPCSSDLGVRTRWAHTRLIRIVPDLAFSSRTSQMTDNAPLPANRLRDTVRLSLQKTTRS